MYPEFKFLIEKCTAFLAYVFFNISRRTYFVELNTFYLKFVLWVPPEHIFNPLRLFFILLWGAVGLR